MRPTLSTSPARLLLWVPRSVALTRYSAVVIVGRLASLTRAPPARCALPPSPVAPGRAGTQRARRSAWVPPPPGCSCALSAPSPSARALTARQVAVPLGAVSPSPQPPGVPRARPRGVCPLASAPCSLWSACTGPARAPRRVGAVFSPRGPRWRTILSRVAGAPRMQ